MADAPRLTDRFALSAHRLRASRTAESEIHALATVEIEERLQDVNKSFTKPLLIGNIPDSLRARFSNAPIIDDSDRLDMAPGQHDLVIHAFGLHWADDPVGQLVQSRLALKPDGLFLGVLFAGQTLHELRAVLAEVESSLSGGLSPRVAPMADVRALGDLLLRAGMALPVADSVRLEPTFSDIGDLARELRSLGETNALFGRRTAYLGRPFWTAANYTYGQHFAAPSDRGKISATFELVFLTGWAPDDSQQKPLRPGSARARLADALGVPELPSGDLTDPNRR